MEMRTRQPDDPVWRAAMARGIECPQCGKAMRKRKEAHRDHPHPGAADRQGNRLAAVLLVREEPG